MMENLRAAANNTVLKIILGIVIVAFTLSGVGGYLVSSHSDYAAKVNGEEISRTAYQNATNQYGEAGLQQLIYGMLLNQYSKKLALDVSDEQIRQDIFQNKAFQINDKFDNQRYQNTLHDSGITPEQYAKLLRGELTTSLLINGLIRSDFILPEETERLATLLAQQRVVRQATINVSALADKQQASAAEINSHYQDQQDQFIVPEQFRVSYIEFDAASRHPSISDEEINNYYQQHKSEFSSQPQSRYSMILTKSKAEASAIVDQLKQGAEFAKLAKEKSADTGTASKGGDLGWIADIALPPEFKNAGLKEKGQLSDVINSDSDYLVVRLDDTRPAEPAPLAQVKDNIADKLSKEKAINEWYALQQKVSDAANNDTSSLHAAAQQAGVKIQETDWFSRNNVPAELNNNAVLDSLFNGSLLTENGQPANNSDVISTDDNRAFVLRISSHKAQTVKPLDEVREQVIDSVKQKKALEQAKKQAAQLLIQLQTGKGDAALQAAGLAFSAPQTIGRNTQDPLNQTIFSLSAPAKDKISYGIGSDGQGNVVLLALDAVQTDTTISKDITALAQRITASNGQHALDILLQNLYNKASIKMNVQLQQEQ